MTPLEKCSARVDRLAARVRGHQHSQLPATRVYWLREPRGCVRCPRGNRAATHASATSPGVAWCGLHVPAHFVVVKAPDTPFPRDHRERSRAAAPTRRSRPVEPST